MRHKIIALYKKADKGKYAIGAFNFSTNEILKGIFDSAFKLKAPVIIATSQGERNFFGCEESVAVYKALYRKYPNIILHADHTKSFEEIKKIVDAGYPSVHFDGSELDFETNLRETKKAVKYAHRHGVFIEGELGGIKGGSTTHKDKSLKDVLTADILTNPEQAVEFVKKTKVDSLAISVGNAHGLWKDYKALDFDRIKKIKDSTRKFLVLHGGSGITPEDFRKAISLGINKININTENRIAFVNALAKGLKERKDDVPYNYLKDVSAAISAVVDDKIKTFISDGKV
ncbi:class II fructose-bisphosphate aldolase [Candidatus Woesearchaeota archaeon]|nr:class II fructose-bisphosphate aldolase [Candidatus Woesearchaeota archaeon]